MYTPASDKADTQQFGFQVRDSGGTANGGSDLDATSNSIVINIDEINDAPTLLNEGATYNEGSENVVTATVLNATDPDDEAQDLLFSLQKLPLNGKLTLNGKELSNGDTFSSPTYRSINTDPERRDL